MVLGVPIGRVHTFFYSDFKLAGLSLSVILRFPGIDLPVLTTADDIPAIRADRALNIMLYRKSLTKLSHQLKYQVIFAAVVPSLDLWAVYADLSDGIVSRVHNQNIVILRNVNAIYRVAQ